MSAHRFSFGINSLDRVLGGGIPPGAVLSIVGNPGSGKSLLGFRYILTGLENGEEGLYISFTSIPLSTLIEEAMKYPLLDPLLSYVNPLFVEVSGPEVLYEVIDMIERSEVRRVVLDHPEVLGHYGDAQWFEEMEEFLRHLRSLEVGTLVLRYPGSGTDGAPLSYLCEGLLSLSLGHSLKREANLNKWPYESEGETSAIAEEEVGEWMS